MPWRSAGEDVTEELNIVKYEPPVPIYMSGQLYGAYGKTPKYDIENIKKYPDMFKLGEQVVITEKIHGTWCVLGRVDGEDIVSSLGVSEKGLAFKLDSEENKAKNLYVKNYLKNMSNLDRVCEMYPDASRVYVMGEIFGGRIQDLKYGLAEPDFRVFDIRIDGEWLTHEEILLTGFEYVPILYRGEFSKEVVASYTDGLTQISSGNNIREGVVIRAFPDARTETGERKIAKSVSEDYLLRKGGTEYK